MQSYSQTTPLSDQLTAQDRKIFAELKALRENAKEGGIAAGFSHLFEQLSEAGKKVYLADFGKRLEEAHTRLIGPGRIRPSVREGLWY